MIEIQNLSKSFAVDGDRVDALRNVSLTVPDGDIYGIIGMSGAGKSTLVRCINMLERPTAGKVLIDGTDIGALSERELRAARRDITMIFQGFNLLMQRNCLDNICFPLELAGVPRAQAKEKALELLETVGLPDKARAYPAQLSGGQQQRIAIARALATNPRVLLCDEATSALDPKTTHSILELIRDINERLGITVIIITHQMSVIEEVCRHVAILDDGVVVEQGEVSEVFARPQSAAARRLVFPDGMAQDAPHIAGGKTLRLVFNGADAAGEPLIARLAVEQHVFANILAASTKNIGGRIFGNMLLSVPDEGDAAQKVLAYLQGVPNMVAEEVAEHVS